MRVLFGLTLTALLCSCHHENVKYKKAYFDFDSLVNAQIQKLGEVKAKLVKKTFLNGKRDSTIFVPNTTQWKYELDAFQQVDVINKPLYRDNYLQKEQKDVHSNLIVRSYSAKIKSTIPEVKFFYQDNFKKLRRIEAIFREGNIVYTTARKLTMEFEEQKGVLVISDYRVEGFQKMMLSDTVKFLIEGKL